MHKPVLLDEVLNYLDPGPGMKVIDATINGGGHGLAIAERIQPDGKLLGIEWDNEIFKSLKFKIESLDLENITLINDSYVNLKKIAEKNGFTKADGVLFDFGISFWHLESGRGFSFQKDEILDMRFSPDLAVSALEIVNQWTEKELEKVIKEYGEESFARQIAREITEERKEGIIKTTGQLVGVIKKAVPNWYANRRLHPATKTFQALRMAVNHELENIEKGIRAALEVLKPGGRLAVISFHGLEGKVVKKVAMEAKKEGILKIITKNVIRPSWEEIKNNPRARSAKLRVYEKQII
ncbi:MAG: 16S rRNA (cytosine(1402)-N(4))-methyltransferase [Candidatus Yanofskybacteria bacterium RIFCSPHIGHO2_02_FULL_43_15c]|uniref:Ribosomal RNA small subunit methyltransferase H n=2 Tax=Candidatus Yanofskyibacteriota TaxID=1752733 RepID=A0A1F8H346_9BACT|nr:MAG: 16S rRNA (cytosine(1402)-N(4))-methyltransferase [Candidatus Yanofskybacteria bacterium RIFCSPHIGHO2_02_FULL_43_15c]OGN32023.1 MAG: 16S rRNA (cytosine(1402)-N(4))-methyltransferase [Candidatus Yanofskybacteria bacterium RIFCSPLOWO2_02_FULL_43_10b]